MNWQPGPPPVADDGSPVLVVLRLAEMHGNGFEYFGAPVVVSRWSTKLKTTIEARRLSYGDVVAWAELPAGWEHHVYR